MRIWEKSAFDVMRICGKMSNDEVRICGKLVLLGMRIWENPALYEMCISGKKGFVGNYANRRCADYSGAWQDGGSDV